MTDWVYAILIVAAVALAAAAVYRAGGSDQKVKDSKEDSDEFKKTAQEFADAPQSDNDFSRRMRNRIDRKD